MQLIQDIDELKKWLSINGPITLIPTMGALHSGHLSLVDIAKKFEHKIIVSVFVNPLQFAQGEDLEKYPRDLEKDYALLQPKKIDLMWAPKFQDIYPESQIQKIYAKPELSNCLCGLSRKGHFDGVVTVVKRLFEITKAQIAIFGEKDYQQLLIIQDMVKQYNLNIQIVSAPIVREPDGLAMSSRNQYLNSEERILAGKINQIILKNPSKAREKLEQAGIEVEYLEEKWGRILVAAKIGQTRLIDNYQA